MEIPHAPIPPALEFPRLQRRCGDGDDGGWMDGWMNNVGRMYGDRRVWMDDLPTPGPHCMSHRSSPIRVLWAWWVEGRFTLRWRGPPVGQECLAKTW